MMQKIVSLRKNLGRRRYNKFIDDFLKKGLLQKVRTTSPTEVPLEKAKELSTLIENDRFKIEEEYNANVSDGLSMILTARFDNGYTLNAFGKFLNKNSDKLEKGSAVEDFLKAHQFSGAPAGYIFERIAKDEAFRCTELLDVALDEKGAMAIPQKAGIIDLMGGYSTIKPDEKIKALLKEDNYTNYFKQKFFDAKTKNKDETEDAWKHKEGFEDLVERFAALGAELDTQPKSIVHNDLHRKNVVKIKSAPSTPKIIDWDDASIGAIQKDLYRLNMSVYEHNCVNAKDARDVSVKKLHEAIQNHSQGEDTQKYTDSLEGFTRKYLITDALENLRFTAIAAAGAKSCKDTRLSDFYNNLKDLVYTRALDTLNEMGETKLEERMEEFGKQNRLNRWDKETRANYEKTVHPDLLIGELRANDENKEEEQNERAFLFNQAANKRVRKRWERIGIAALTAVTFGTALLGYLTTNYGFPLINKWQATDHILAKEKNLNHDELKEVLISRPEEIEQIVKTKGDTYRMSWNSEDPDSKEAEKIIENYEQRRDGIYKSIDEQLAKIENPHKNLLTENILPLEQREKITKEYIRLLGTNCAHPALQIMIEENMKRLQDNLRAGIFSPQTIIHLEEARQFEIEFFGKKDEILKSMAKAKIQTPEDLLSFFKTYSADPITTMLLQQAIETHNNSLVVKYEKIKALPAGTLDTLIFTSLFKSKLHDNLRNYVSSLGHDTKLLKQDEFFVGYLASYAASMLDKHKDLATAIAAMTNGEDEVEKAMICADSLADLDSVFGTKKEVISTDSRNFFKYKYYLSDTGTLAETAWHYFARKNLSQRAISALSTLRSYDTERKGKNFLIRENQNLKVMEETIGLLESTVGEIEDLSLQLSESLDKALDKSIKNQAGQIQERYELLNFTYQTFEKYSKNMLFQQEYPIETTAIREFLPTIKKAAIYFEANIQYDRIMLERSEELKDCKDIEKIQEINEKYLERTREPVQIMEATGVSSINMNEFNQKIKRISDAITEFAEKYEK